MELVKVEPRSVGGHTMLGLLHYVEGNVEEAKAWWEKALIIDPHAAAASNNLAWLYTETGENLDMALQLALTARSKFPDLPEVNDTLGWVYYRKDLTEQALRYLQRSVDLDPKNPLYHFHVGMAYAKRGEDARARRALQQALNLKSDFEGAAEARKTLGTLVY
jgi:tetratricopeptide (TPR) repeat protein